MSVDQLERLVKIVLKPESDDRIVRHDDFGARLSAVRAIAAYGEPAIPALIQISEESKNSQIQEYALEKIGNIKRYGRA